MAERRRGVGGARAKDVQENDRVVSWTEAGRALDDGMFWWSGCSDR
jgi:hypothetical protein